MGLIILITGGNHRVNQWYVSHSVKGESMAFDDELGCIGYVIILRSSPLFS